jgi:hypothetical protein
VTGRLIGVLLILLIWTCLAAVLGPLIGDFLRRCGQLSDQPLGPPRRASTPQLVAAPDHLPDPRLEPLRRELAGLDVSWQMTDEQRAAMLALLKVHGPQLLAEVALDLVATLGKPSFARAWLGHWGSLPLPGGAVGEQRTAS